MKETLNNALIELRKQVIEAQNSYFAESDIVEKQNKSVKLAYISSRYRKAQEQYRRLMRSKKLTNADQDDVNNSQKELEDIIDQAKEADVELKRSLYSSPWEDEPKTASGEIRLSSGETFRWDYPRPKVESLKVPDIGESIYDKITTTVSNTTSNSKHDYGGFIPVYRTASDTNIMNKYTENMAKSKLSKAIHDLIMQFEMTPSKQGLNAVLKYLEYPEPWPAFDSVKDLSIVNDKIVIETYDSESQIDRDLFNATNGIGYGIQPPRHKKSESSLDKLLKPKGGEVGVQPARTFKVGRTLRLS